MRADDSNAGKGFETGNPPRLTEESGVDPWLVSLVRSTGPYKSPPGRKQRVLLSLGRSKVRRAPLLLRPAIVAGVLIGCGALASAALGPWRGWIGRTYERVVPSSRSVAVSRERVRRHRLVAGHAETIAAQGLAVATPPPESSSPDVAPSPASPLHLRHAPPAAAREEGKHESARHETARDRGKEDQETQAVLAGMRALRVDHDPVRARSLLAQYLARRPEGALAEEALALTMEAALAHQDDDAPALGALYLRRYPEGPFKGLALRAKR